jgi:hypothetical protein
MAEVTAIRRRGLFLGNTCRADREAWRRNLIQAM